MNFEQNRLIQVHFVGRSVPCRVGRLALKGRKIFFEYAPEFIKTGLALSPFKLPLKPGVMACEDQCFGGLFGVFNDSLPDGWGRWLLDRKLISLGISPGELSPLDRLCYVGSGGMGALVYQPEIVDTTPHPYRPYHHPDLNEIAREILQFQENDDDQFVDDLLAISGSSAGARPKIVITLQGEAWMVKFRSSLDPQDIGPIEYAYHAMAKAANIEVSKAKLLPAKKGAGYFGVQRFDRIADKRLHMHTVSGLLHADHRIPSLDYQTIMQVTLRLTKDVRACEKQFRAALFNVLSHNRDDHAKNFCFLMDEQGVWRVSPAYDLTFSSGPAGEHCTLIMGEGKNPRLSHLLKLAEVGGIKKSQALLIIDEVKMAIARWPLLAKEAGVSTASLTMVQTAINSVAKMVFAA